MIFSKWKSVKSSLKKICDWNSKGIQKGLIKLFTCPVFWLLIGGVLLFYWYTYTELFFPKFLKFVKSKEFLAIVTGFYISLVGGHIFTTKFLVYTRGGEPKDKDKQKVYLPARLAGFVEGFFFTLFIALDPRIAAGIIPWIALKMATGWRRVDNDTESQGFETWKNNALSSMYGGLINLSFAAIGGFLIHFLWTHP